MFRVYNLKRDEPDQRDLVIQYKKSLVSNTPPVNKQVFLPDPKVVKTNLQCFPNLSKSSN